MGEWRPAQHASLFTDHALHSFPSSSLGTHSSAKLRFVRGECPARACPLAARRKQSFQDKCVTKLELGHEVRPKLELGHEVRNLG